MQRIAHGPARVQPPITQPVSAPASRSSAPAVRRFDAAKSRALVRATKNEGLQLHPSSAHGVTCRTDGALNSRGWRVSNENFAENSAKVRENFESNRSHFVPDTEGVVYSSVARRLVRIESFDDLRTPQGEMFGDVAFFTDAVTGEAIETRWYAEGKKQAVYAPAATPCATNVIPMAENSLF